MKQLLQRTFVAVLLVGLSLSLLPTQVIGQGPPPVILIPVPNNDEPRLPTGSTPIYIKITNQKAKLSSAEYAKAIRKKIHFFYHIEQSIGVWQRKKNWKSGDIATFYEVFPDFEPHRSDKQWTSAELKAIDEQRRFSVNLKVDAKEALEDIPTDALVDVVLAGGGRVFMIARNSTKESKAVVQSESRCIAKSTDPNLPTTPHCGSSTGGLARELDNAIVTFDTSTQLGKVDLDLGKIFKQSKLSNNKIRIAAENMLRTAGKILDHPVLGKFYNKDRIAKNMQEIKVTTNLDVNTRGEYDAFADVIAVADHAVPFSYPGGGSVVANDPFSTVIHEINHGSVSRKGGQFEAYYAKHSDLDEGFTELIARIHYSYQGGTGSYTAYRNQVEIASAILSALQRKFGSKDGLERLATAYFTDPHLLDKYFSVASSPRGIKALQIQSEQASRFGFHDYVSEILGKTTDSKGNIIDQAGYDSLLTWLNAWGK